MKQELTKEYLEAEYVGKARSTYDIAKEQNTYSNKICRALKRFGIPLRDKSEALKEALASGRKIHPTAGKELDIATKAKISRKKAESWSKLDKKTRKERTDKLLADYNKLSKTTKNRIKDKRQENLLKASQHGSKIEKYFLDHLIANEFRVQFHRKGLIPNSNLEIDLFLPDDRVAIEIDGVTHFDPIYGHKDLSRVQHADSTKTGLLLSRGFVVIRIKLLINHIRQFHIEDAFLKTMEILKQVRQQFPGKGKRFFEFSIE